MFRFSLFLKIALVTIFVAILVSYLYPDGRQVTDDKPVTTELQHIARFELEVDSAAGSVDIIERSARNRPKASVFFRQALAQADENANARLDLIDIQLPGLRVTPNGVIFPINATFESTSGDVLTNVFFKVVVLDYTSGGDPKPELFNADRNGTGEGSELDADLPNNELALGETFDTTFDILLPRLERFSFFVDAFATIVSVVPEDDEPPTISATLDPLPNAEGWHNTAVTVSFDCSDSGSGIASCSSPVTVDAEGEGQVVTGTAIDQAGNTATASVTLNIDSTPPSVEITSHTGDETLTTPEVTISGTISDDLSGVSGVTCNGISATVSDTTFSCNLALVEGANVITVHATDIAGNPVSTSITIFRVAADVTPPPVPELISPENEAVIDDNTPTFEWTEVTDPSGVSYELQVGTDTGFTAPLAVGVMPSDTSFTLLNEQALGVGLHFWRVRSVDGEGNQSDFSPPHSFSVVEPQALSVNIESPENLTTFPSEPITVIGTVTGIEPTVEVNGVSADVSGGTFTANIPLQEGNNLVTAVAQDLLGQLGTDSIQVTLDTTPPTVTIDSPPDGSVTTTPFITVTGMINDIVVGTVNGDQATVLVNGIPAQVSNRSYSLADVPLAEGDNTITVVGTDRAGNTATTSITVEFVQSLGMRSIKLVSGNNQSAQIGEELLESLVVQLVDENDQPVANERAIFRVTENNGALRNGSGDSRGVTVMTDAAGLAQVHWTLGTRAGAGNNMVSGSAVGFEGEVLFTATGIAASPHMISVDIGNNQTGSVNQPLPKPFIAIVSDEGHNRLPGIPVTFKVVEGDGNFNGQDSITLNTDSDGRALVVLTLGPDDGFDNNVVEANFEGNQSFPARFVATGMIPGDPEDTSISGVVLDNSDQPISGVTLSIVGTQIVTQSDEQGQFLIKPAPVGSVMLVADGSTAQRPGTWPSLEFDMVTVSGQNNTLSMPIYLLPLDIPNGLQVDEDTGGTLTLPDVPGFSLTVEAGSATFPDGGKEGTISVTVVHVDKIPMVPGFGQQPRIIVTIQPAGVIFDPPAPITLPNVDGLAPGEVAEMYSFDHDLGQFISIGTGTVSEDGLILASDPGVGIIKGGWHCGGNPQTTGGAENAHVNLTSIEDLQGDLNAAFGSGPGPHEATVVGGGDQPPVYRLKFRGGPTPATGTVVSSDPDVVAIVTEKFTTGSRSVSRLFEAKKPGTATITITWVCQSGATATTSVKITVTNVDLEIEGIPEFAEENVGGFTGINQDQLTKINLNIPSRALEFDRRTLDVSDNGRDKIKVWTTQGKTQEIILPATWGFSDTMPTMLFVEGIKESDSLRDIELTLSLIRVGPGPVLPFSLGEDTAKLTVLKVDVEFPGLTEDDEDDKDILLGQNNNDDNENEVQDLDDDIFVGDDPDLKPFKVTVKPSLPSQLGDVTLTSSSGLSVWPDASKDNLSLLNGLSPDSQSTMLSSSSQESELFVEGLSVSSVPKRIKLEVVPQAFVSTQIGTIPLGNKISDEINIIVVQADIEIPDLVDDNAEVIEFSKKTGPNDVAMGSVLGRVDDDKVDKVDGKNLKKLEITFRPSGLNLSDDAKVELSITQGASKIGLWRERDDSGTADESFEVLPVQDNKVTFEPDELPMEIFVQGREISAINEVVIELSFFENDPSGSLTKIHTDKISLTVKGALLLRPLVVPIFAVPNSTPVQLQLFREDPTVPDKKVVDVPITEDIKFEWIGSPDGDLGRGSLFNRALKSIKDDLFKDIGEDIDKTLEEFLGFNLDVAELSIDASGMMTVNGPGLNIVRASNEDETTNIIVVLGGFSFKGIKLTHEPFSSLSLLGLVNTALKDLSDKTPMILVPDDVGWVSDKGTVKIDDIEFQILGTSDNALSISLKDVLDAIDGLIDDALDVTLEPALTAAFAELGPGAPLAAKIVTEAVASAIKSGVEAGVKRVITEFMEFESSNEAVAKLIDIPLFNGTVQAGVPGWATITGTLDLGPDFGKKSAKISVWVLPDAKKVTIIAEGDPPGEHERPVILHLTDPKHNNPGINLRAFVELEIVGEQTFTFDNSIQSTTEFLDKILPGGIDSLIGNEIKIKKTIPIPGRLGDTFTFSIAGRFEPPLSQITNSVTFKDITLGFDVPKTGPITQGLTAGILSVDWHLLKDPAAISPVDFAKDFVKAIFTNPANPLAEALKLDENVAKIDDDSNDLFNVQVHHQRPQGQTTGETGEGFILVAFDLTGFLVPLDSIFDTRALIVRVAPIESIAITPVTAEVVLGIGEPESVQYTAIATLANGDPLDITNSATWSSSNSDVAGIDPSGVATGKSAGETKITATEDGVTSNEATLTVLKVKSILVEPAEASVVLGEGPQTVQYKATGTLTDDTTRNLTSLVTWNSSVPDVAPISGGGLATAAKAGETKITATLEDITSNEATLEVIGIESILVEPATAKIVLGVGEDETVQYKATATLTDDTTRDVTLEATWNSSNDGVATISGTGLATGLSTGTTKITAKLDEITSNEATLDVISLKSIAVEPVAATIVLGEGPQTVQYTATGTFTDDVTTRDLTSMVTWDSSNDVVATISGGGLATAASVGQTSITASKDGLTSNAALLDVIIELKSIAVTPTNNTIALNMGDQTVQYTAIGTFTDDSVKDISNEVVWNSSNNGVATILGTGLATAAGVGQTTIRASKDGVVSNAATLNVIAVLKSIAITPVNAFIILGIGDQTVQYNAVGTFSDDTIRNITSESDWNSSNTDTATISNAGLATAQNVGNTRITASKDGITSNQANLNVVVFSPPAVQVVINEVVVEPQQDWDDSGGGAGIGDPFDDKPGDGTGGQINLADQWIEIKSRGTATANLFNWSISFQNSQGGDVTLVFTDPNLTLDPGEYLVIGNPSDLVLVIGRANGELVTVPNPSDAVVVIGNPLDIGLSSTIALTDAALGNRGSINLEQAHIALGNATGVADEAIARVPDGAGGNDLSDFQRKAATIGSANPAE